MSATRKLFAAVFKTSFLLAIVFAQRSLADCNSRQFTCGDGRCISHSWRCDGHSDCVDSSDEQNCRCRSSEFSCLNGNCVPRSRCANGNNDCYDNTDETICVPINTTPRPRKTSTTTRTLRPTPTTTTTTTSSSTRSPSSDRAWNSSEPGLTPTTTAKAAPFSIDVGTPVLIIAVTVGVALLVFFIVIVVMIVVRRRSRRQPETAATTTTTATTITHATNPEYVTPPVRPKPKENEYFGVSNANGGYLEILADYPNQGSNASVPADGTPSPTVGNSVKLRYEHLNPDQSATAGAGNEYEELRLGSKR